MTLTRCFSNLSRWIVIGIVALVLLGCANEPRTSTRFELTAEYVCGNNLRQIAQAKRYWIVDNPNGPYPHPDFFIGPGLYLPAMPKCPSGGTYNPGGRYSAARCSFHGTRSDVRKAQREADSQQFGE